MLIQVSSYPVVAEARGHRTLWYRQFGSYQGEWLLFSQGDDHYWVWRGSYGSCSGCDAFEAHFGSSGEYETESPQVQNFIKDYTPFLKLRPDAALNMAMRDDTLLPLLPRNQRDWLSSIPREEVGHQLALLVKGQAGKLTPTEILDLDNQEIRRDAIEAYGPENFISELKPDVVDDTEEGVLYVIVRPPGTEDYAFLYVKDPSTERRYVLRVDPAHQNVRAARASTFGFSAADFVLAQET